ncbi:MAG: glycosyltransferase family 9 protein [Candidatus Pacearchaeota archaeon]
MKTLIINLGPLGDVVRTTVLLREIEGEIYWLTKRECKDVLLSKRIKKIIFFEDEASIENLKKINFDLVISLNEELDALNVVKELKYDRLIGVFLNREGRVDYTKDSSYWFDMSLSSKYGKAKADELKAKNTKSLPQILIEMIGKGWHEQEYDLGIEGKKIHGRIGIINLVTGKWPNKGWAYYKELAEILKREGFDVKFLGKRASIKEHIEDINNCELIICGDTLGMHIALALKKKVVALFNCTSPNEIYGYGRMEKVVSPLLKKYFYKKEFNEEAIKAIKIEEVHKAIKKILKE